MPSEPPRIKPLAAIICDDIRTEDNNKEMLIGIYSADLVIHKKPTNLKLGVHLLVETKGSGIVPIKVTVEGSALSRTAIGKGSLEILQSSGKKQHIGLSFPNLLVQVEKKGDIIVKLKQHDGRKNTVKILPVRYQPKEEAVALPNVNPNA